MKSITEYMTKNPLRIAKDSNMVDAIKIMRKKNIGALLIEDEKKKTVGIFTERDLLNRIDFNKPAQLEKMKIEDVMSKNLITADALQAYTDVLKVMQQYNIRHMPVMRDGEIIGIVSLRDLMVHYEESLEHLLGEKEAQLVENLKRLKESEERMRTIFRNTAVAISFADNNERIVSWNPLTEELLGMNEKDLKNKPVKDFFPDEEWKKIRDMHIRDRGGHAHLETKLINKKGEVIDIELSISVLKDSQGNIKGSIGVMRDIRRRRQVENKLHESLQTLESEYTRLKDYQKQIIQMEKMATMGTLAAGFAHEIKNPLAIILQGMERIEKTAKNPTPEESEQYVKMITSAAQRANSVVTSILKYSRASQMEIQQVDLCTTLDSAIELIKNNTKCSDIEIVKKTPKESVPMEGDPIMLQQVFFDLLNNSVDAMPQGGKIDINLKLHYRKAFKKQAGEYIIEIKDTGMGIPTNQLDKIFDPFFTTKDTGKGTGLGLSTVYLIVEKHNGSVNVKSQKGKGTTFIIHLPLKQEEPIAHKEMMPAGGRKKSLKNKK